MVLTPLASPDASEVAGINCANGGISFPLVFDVAVAPGVLMVGEEKLLDVPGGPSVPGGVKEEFVDEFRVVVEALSEAEG